MTDTVTQRLYTKTVRLFSIETLGIFMIRIK